MNVLTQTNPKYVLVFNEVWNISLYFLMHILTLLLLRAAYSWRSTLKRKFCQNDIFVSVYFHSMASYDLTALPGHQELCCKQGAVSIRKTVLLGMAIPMLKIRRPTGRLIFNMGIPIPGKTVFLIETGPGSSCFTRETSNHRGLLYWRGLILISAWINNHTQ